MGWAKIEYRSLWSKRPWALEIDGVGAYTDKLYNAYTCILWDHQKGGVGAYMEMGSYSREYGI